MMKTTVATNKCECIGPAELTVTNFFTLEFL